MKERESLQGAKTKFVGDDKAGTFFCAVSKKIAYLEIKKSGCTTFKNFILQLEGRQDIIESNPLGVHTEEVLKEMTRVPKALCTEGFFKFTFVRHPFGRVFSFWKNKIISWDRGIEAALRQHGFYPSMQWESFIDKLYEIPAFDLEAHIAPVTKFLLDGRGNICVDFIGKLETIERDSERLAAETGLNVVFPHYNKGVVTKDVMWTDDIRSKLAEKYMADLEVLDYSATEWL